MPLRTETNEWKVGDYVKCVNPDWYGYGKTYKVIQKYCDEYSLEHPNDGVCYVDEEYAKSFVLTSSEVITVEVPTEQMAGTKYDGDKLQYDLIPPFALEAVARNLTLGLKKYKEPNNWQKVPNAEKRYLNAIMRHLEAHRKGEVYDPDSPVPDMPHLAAITVNALFLLEFMLNPNLKESQNAG